MKLQSKLNPNINVLKLLDGLKPRTKEIIVKRFGLQKSNKMTLEEIGQNYKITRERVRQIEAAALAELKKSPKYNLIQKIESQLEKMFLEYGKVMEYNFLIQKFLNQYNLDSAQANSVEFILRLSDKFNYIKEDEEIKKTWHLTKANINLPKQLINSFILKLEGKGRPVQENELLSNIGQDFKDSKTLISYLSLSKRVLKNPFQEWGLADWREIIPKGIKDKAYIVLNKYNKPAHFTKITELINDAKFDSKIAVPQTVHNELIKDNRFVLVGRGIYALTKWGYKKGTVAQIIEEVVKSKPMLKEDIVNQVLKQRLVKRNTIILALQNKEKFSNIKGLFTLAQVK